MIPTITGLARKKMRRLIRFWSWVKQQPGKAWLPAGTMVSERPATKGTNAYYFRASMHRFWPRSNRKVCQIDSVLTTTIMHS